jgi:hypothetical protein
MFFPMNYIIGHRGGLAVVVEAALTSIEARRGLGGKRCEYVENEEGPGAQPGAPPSFIRPDTLKPVLQT